MNRYSEVRVVPPQGVELFRGRVFVSTLTSCLTEACCDLIKGAALSLRHLEVGEGEEAEQQDGEDDEDVGAAQLLQDITGKTSFLLNYGNKYVSVQQSTVRKVTASLD